MHWHRYDSQPAQMSALAVQVAAELAGVLKQKQRASLIVPGGGTPVPFFQALSRQELDWTRIDVLPGDERFVALTSPRSNTRLIQEHLQQNAAAESQLIRFWQPDTTPEAMAQKLAATLPLPPDVCVLGMGVDMHTASLFPNTANFAEALDDPHDQRVFVVQPEGQEVRLSLSGAVLSTARYLHLLITGAEKQAALKKAISTEDPCQAPIKALIIKHKNINIHYAD